MDLEKRKFIINLITWMEDENMLTDKHPLIPYEVAELYLESNYYNSVVKPKKKPLELRKQEFKVKVLKFPEYGEIMLDEFIDYWTEHNDNGTVMKFEKEKTFNTSKRLARWHKRSNQYQTKSNGVNQDWA